MTSPDTLGLLEECRQLARDLGYVVREEPLGELPGGTCVIGGSPQILLNLEHSPAERLDRLVRVLTADPQAAAQPMSKLLATRFRVAGDDSAS
jgi:hypothetical protein